MITRCQATYRQTIILLSWALFFNAFCVFSQTDRADILLDQLKSSKGEVYFSKANELAEIYLDNSLPKAKELIGTILNHNHVKDFPLQLAQTYYIQGRLLTLKGKYEAAYVPFDKALEIFKKNAANSKYIRCLLAKGATQTYQGLYTEAKEIFDECLEFYNKNSDEEGLAMTYYEYGHLKYFLSNYNESYDYYKKAIAIFEQLGNKKKLSDCHFRLGAAYAFNGDEGSALKNFVKSRSIKEEIGDMIGLARVNISLSNLNEENGNYEKALDYLRQSLSANSGYGDRRINSIIYNNTGVLYRNWKKYDSSIVYFKKGLEIRQILKSEEGIVQSLANIGDVYQLKGEPNKGIQYYKDAYRLSNTTEYQPRLFNISNKLGLAYLNEKRLDSAEFYLSKAYNGLKEKNDYYALGDSYKNLSLLSEKKGDFKKSLEYHKLYKQVEDSISEFSRNKELAEVQAKHDTAKQEKEINELQQENKSRKLWQNIYAVGGLLALILTVIVFQFFRFRNKKNKELLAIKETQRQQLEEVNQLKTRFFHNISHEFRTPLTLILGPLEQLKKAVDATMQPTVDIIERNGKRLLKLINQLLDLSKIEEGKISLKAAHIDIVPLLKGCVTSFQSMAEIKEVDLSLDLKKQSYFLYVDQAKLEEVIINLLSNALKYTPSGGRVTLDVDQSKNHLCVTVSDTGNGIPKEELSYIFNRFYQASNANTENQIGTGIGLALVKELVELHKGTITVDSEVGKGSSFKVNLPLGKEHLSADEMVTITSTSKTLIEQKVPDVLIEDEIIENDELPILLLIEDNADLRTYIKSILKNDYCIKEAIDGEDGISQAIELVPDIIISDLMMPKVDGLEVSKTLKEDVRTSHIPIILLTARSSKEDKIEGLKSLADDYLTKPFNNEELLVRIENLVAVRSKIQKHFSTGDILMPKKVKLNSIDQDFIKKVTEVLESEISNEIFGVIELADAVALSRSQLFRKIKAITDLTPNEFIRSFRLHRAMDMLKQQSGTIAEIAYSVGFQNPSYFSKCFHEQFGTLPSDVS
ncbi:tetratricopeptide repeat protein [Spongiimicrobium sp. 3-5]|uniref:hybrid sensor histidine kinase/response regulator transcription factor n=1 Tax=Spongiimicrobium sp. 3-5 TaxID=3332596 RepID=UPI00397F84F6